MCQLKVLLGYHLRADTLSNGSVLKHLGVLNLSESKGISGKDPLQLPQKSGGGLQ